MNSLIPLWFVQTGNFSFLVSSELQGAYHLVHISRRIFLLFRFSAFASHLDGSSATGANRTRLINFAACTFNAWENYPNPHSLLRRSRRRSRCVHLQAAAACYCHYSVSRLIKFCYKLSYHLIKRSHCIFRIFVENAGRERWSRAFASRICKECSPENVRIFTRKSGGRYRRVLCNFFNVV